jgi:hypothetical protein
MALLFLKTVASRYRAPMRKMFCDNDYVKT